MTQSEAEKLAHFASQMEGDAALRMSLSGSDWRKLCYYILSGDMRREIENAAFGRARTAIGKCSCISEADDRIWSMIIHASDCAVHNGPALQVGPCDCGALIQPPAQKGDGE